jgi:hypothetical protein
MKRPRVNGEEQDAFSRRYRRYLSWRPGELHKIKRRSAKRERRNAQAEIMEAMHDEDQRGEPV